MLKAPTEKQKNNGNTVSPEEDNVEMEEVERSSDEENEEKDEEAESTSSNELNDDAYYTELSSEAARVMRDISDWDVDDYVVVRYNQSWYSGIITESLDDGTFRISCMEFVNKFERDNKFRWPIRKDEKTYEREDMIWKLEKPVEHIGRRMSYHTRDSEFEDAMNI